MSAAEDLEGRRIGAWQLGRALGSGGIGVVHAATHVDTGVAGAIKLARPDGGPLADHWFAREARLAARLRHPHIVTLLDHGLTDAGRPFLVYERVEGSTLEAAADRMGVDAIVRLGSELLDALGYAHDAGVVHCDVTPGNVLLDRDRGCAARLIDFGLAKARDEARSRRTTDLHVSGTPGYLSPEQARGIGSPGPASDLFGAGAVLFRALTGYAPYGGVSPMEVVHHTRTTAPLPLQPRDGLRAPMKLAEVVQRLLSRDPEHRYPSAARARRAWLEAAQTRTPVEGAVRPSLPPTPGLQSMETILVQPLRSGEEDPGAVFSTLRATPSAGLERRAFRPRFAPSRLERPDAQRAILDALLPHPSAIVGVHAPQGAGKSDLLASVRDALREAGVRVCQVRGRQRGSCAPFEPLATAMLDALGVVELSPLRLAAEVLVDRVTDAGADEAGWGTDALIGGLIGIGPTGALGSAQNEAFRVCDALLEPDRRPAVIVLADAGSIDEGTWSVVQALARRPGGGVGVLWSAREPLDVETDVRVALSPLPPEALDAAWRSWSGSESPRPADHPADLRALAAVRELADVTSFDAYLDCVGPAERALLQAAVVFGGDVPQRGLVKVAGLLAAPHAIGEDHLAAMKRARLFVDVDASCARRERWVRLPSPALRGRVRARMPGAERANARALCAQWLARDCLDDSASNLARIARLAEATEMPASAAHAWSEAARMELESGRPRAAAPHLERALAQAGEADAAVDRPRLHLWMATAALAAGRPAEAEAHGARAEALVEPERPVLRARIAHARAEAAIAEGRNEDAIAYCDAALEGLDEDGDPMELARALASKGWVLGYRMGDNEQGIALGRRALEVAARIEAPTFQASLCGRLGANYLRAGDWDGQLATNERDLALSTEARNATGMIRANINLGVCFHNRGDLATARVHTERALELAERCGQAGAAQIAANNLAMIALDDGRGDDVDRHVAAVLEGAERTGYRRAIPETLITAARLDTRRGALDEAEAKLARAAEAGDVADLEMAQRAWALLELARGAADAAVARMAAVISAPIHDPHERACSRVTFAAALRRAGRGDDADGQLAQADRGLAELGADPAVERRRWGDASSG